MSGEMYETIVIDCSVDNLLFELSHPRLPDCSKNLVLNPKVVLMGAIRTNKSFLEYIEDSSVSGLFYYGI